MFITLQHFSLAEIVFSMSASACLHFDCKKAFATITRCSEICIFTRSVGSFYVFLLRRYFVLTGF